MKERYRRALELRNAGASFRAIGEELDVGAQRAREIYIKALRWKDTSSEWWHGLPVMAKNCLLRAGCESKEQALRLLDTKPRIENLGKKGRAEVYRWLGRPIEPKGKRMNAEDVELAIRKAIALSYERWSETGEPVRPDSKEAEILVAEALTAVLQDAIEKRKKETQ